MNLEAGVPVVGKVNPVTQFCFAMGAPESAKHILGNSDEPPGIEEKDEY